MTLGKVALIITSCNTAPLLEICIKSHFLYTPFERVDYILADASNDSSCREIYNVLVSRISQGSLYIDFRGTGTTYSILCDVAVRKYIELRGSPKYLVFVNDDTVATPNWLEIMEADFQNLELLGYQVGLLGARTNYPPGPQLGVWEPSQPGVRVCPRVVSFFCMVLTEPYIKSGGFDIDLPSNNYADETLSIRLLQEGYHNFCSRAFIPHFGSQAFSRSHVDIMKDLAVGQDYMAHKYGSVWPTIYTKPYPAPSIVNPGLQTQKRGARKGSVGA